jgi:serine/threonine protein kinase
MSTYVLSDSSFSIPSRYVLKEPIGQGAYGLVIAGVDLLTSQRVAIKKITGVFDHLSFGKRTLRELRILRFLKHENILSISDLFVEKTTKFTDSKTTDAIYAVTPMMSTDLASVIRSHQILTNEHITFFTYQIFRGLKYLHSAGVVHRDLKLRNLLVSENCDLKICDFGLSRATFSNQNETLTDYTCTRWFRAPEVLLSLNYGVSSDIWSAACVFAELITRKPLLPGQNTHHQLQLVVKLTGSLREEEMNKFDEKAAAVLEQIGTYKRKDFKLLFSGATKDAVDLLEKLLLFCSWKRLSASQALKHPYFSQFHQPKDEPIREEGRLPEQEFAFDKGKFDITRLKDEINKELDQYKQFATFAGQRNLLVVPVTAPNIVYDTPLPPMITTNSN